MRGSFDRLQDEGRGEGGVRFCPTNVGGPARSHPADGRELVFDAGAGISEADEQPETLDVPRGETQDIADSLIFADLRLAAGAVFQRVHCAARLAGLGFWAGRALPWGPVPDQRGLACAAFRRPALAAAVRSGTNTLLTEPP